MNQGLKKLKIIAYTSSEYKESDKTGEVFEALFNPQEFTIHYEIQYTECQAPGNSADDPKYHRTKPQVITLDFIFDSTGVAANEQSVGSGLISSLSSFAPSGLTPPAKPLTVKKQLERFKDVTLKYHRDIHSPKYVEILWGTLSFKGRLTDLKVTYNLFKPDGTPLRAKANATFKEFIKKKKQVAEEEASSPDLTHLRTVQSGDTLPLMAYRIYGDASYYLEVARVNQLTNFRDLNPGEQIFFPPIKESIE